MSDSEELKALADAIADGRPIDWDGAKRAHPADQDLVAELEILSLIANLHRQAPEAAVAGDNDSTPDASAADDAAGGLDDGTDRPPFQWGRLHVLQKLGGGAFGKVFRAFDPQLNREVALKLLPVDASAGPPAGPAVIREGELLARVKHKNVMDVYNAERIGGRVGIWGELVHGHTLAEIVEEYGPLSAAEASIIGLAVCRALTAVHRRGLLHRDIKAQNVMREIGGRIVLVDFGLGREANVPQAEHGGRELAGTPLYLAPELFRGDPATAQSDLYAVGVLLFFLITSTYPVRGDTIEEIASQHALRRRMQLQDEDRDLPDDFVRIVDRALAQDVAERFKSAGELQQALAATLGPPVPVPGPPTAAPRRRLPVALAGALAAGILVGIAAMTRFTPAPLDQLALTLSAPTGATFVEGSRNVPAVSPDGQQIAFIAKDGEGDRLWVRSLANPRSRAIPNTSGAIRPFWSPDGRWIAYFVNQGERRGLWRVNPAGAQPEFLAQGTESRGGSWNREDTLLLALDPHQGLQAMSARPGAAMRFVTKVDTAGKQAQHMWPQFLPDGRRFIFFVLSGDDNVEGVYLGSLDGAQPRLLVKTHTSALHVGTSLLYTNNGRLFSQTLDLAADALTGTPRPLDLDVDSTYDWLLVLAASENGTLVYRRPELRQLVWYSMNGNELSPLGQPGRFRNPAISPDGTVVVAERYLLDQRELVAFDLKHGTEEVLPLPKAPSCPAWAPDGRLAFAAMTGNFSDIYVTDIRRPRDLQLLVRSDREKEPTGWSPDGAALAYVSFETNAQGRHQDLWISSTDQAGRTTQRPLATSPTAAEVNGAFSPAGRWIAYVSNEERQANVYVSRPGETTRYKVSSGPALDPQWISDDVLLYLDGQGVLWQVTLPAAGTPAPFQPTRLFRSPVRTPGTSRNNYAVAPDKKRLLFNAWPESAAPSAFSVIVHWRDLAGREASD